MKHVPSKIQTEVAKYASSFGTKGALTHFKTKYPKFKFKHSTINTWKKKFASSGSNEQILHKRICQPNFLNDEMIKKIKDIIVGTRIAG